MMLGELLNQYPDRPVEIYCAACWQRFRLQRLGRYPVEEHVGDWVHLNFGGRNRRGRGRWRVDVAPNRDRSADSDVLYEWDCPNGHHIERRDDGLGRVEGILRKDCIRAYV